MVSLLWQPNTKSPNKNPVYGFRDLGFRVRGRFLKGFRLWGSGAWRIYRVLLLKDSAGNGSCIWKP